MSWRIIVGMGEAENWCVRIYFLKIGIQILPPAIKGTVLSELFLKTLLVW